MIQLSQPNVKRLISCSREPRFLGAASSLLVVFLNPAEFRKKNLILLMVLVLALLLTFLMLLYDFLAFMMPVREKELVAASGIQFHFVKIRKFSPYPKMLSKSPKKVLRYPQRLSRTFGSQKKRRLYSSFTQGNQRSRHVSEILTASLTFPFVRFLSFFIFQFDFPFFLFLALIFCALTRKEKLRFAILAEFCQNFRRILTTSRWRILHLFQASEKRTFTSILDSR